MIRYNRLLEDAFGLILIGKDEVRGFDSHHQLRGSEDVESMAPGLFHLSKKLRFDGLVSKKLIQKLIRGLKNIIKSGCPAWDIPTFFESNF